MNRHAGHEVVDALVSLGVDTVFGIISVHNLPIYEALAADGRVHPVTVRHEQAAVAMADGYARTSGRLGVAITSTGPGAANGMAAMLEAWAASSPVLHLTGQVDSRHLDRGRGYIHECPDQPAMLGAAAKSVIRVGSADDVAATVAAAGVAAMQHRQRPVAVEIPIDIQYRPAGPAPDQTASRPAADQVAADLGPALERLRDSRRPLIWAGGGVIAAGAAGELVDVAELLQAGVVTSPNGRGSIPEHHPLCVGNLTWEESVRSLLREADLLLAVGTRFQGPNTQNWQLQLPGVLVHIDVDADMVGLNYPAAVGIVGDARNILIGLAGGLRAAPGRTEPAWSATVLAARDDARASLRATLGPYESILDVLDESLPSDTVVVKDATIPAYTWGNRLLPVSAPRTSIMPSSFAIGLGLPQAIGAAVARRGSQVVLIVGDGGFMVSMPELLTAVDEGVSLLVLLFNDQGFGILRNIEEHQYDSRFCVDVRAPDFVALADAVGVDATRVESVSEFAAAVTKYVGTGGVAMIEIVMDAIGPMRRPYVGTSMPPSDRNDPGP